MKIGDLVKNIEEPEMGLGVVTGVDLLVGGYIQEPPGVKVFWNNPTWYDTDDGASVMYEDEIMVVSPVTTIKRKQ